VRQEWRALKDAGALLVDNDVGRLWRELVIDAVIRRVGGFLLASRRDGAIGPILRAMVLGAVENRDAGAPNGSDDTATLQAILTAGNIVSLRPGQTYHLSEKLNITQSNSGILTTGAVTIAEIKIQYLQALIPVAGLLIAAGLHLFFQNSRYGKALLAHLARLAQERQCGRVEWAVLEWNTPSIDFYRSLGAVSLEDWRTFRLTGDALDAVAAKEHEWTKEKS